MELLLAHDVCKAYGKQVVLDQMSFDLKQGEIHTLLGRNGAGKTTFIKILSTLLAKDSGMVRIGEYDMDRDAGAIRRLIGYVGQDTERSAYARLTARENLLFFGRLRGLKVEQIRAQVDRLSGYFEFHDKLDKQFMHLSGGQKQALVIMRALLHPTIVYLDEPTKGLDPFVAKKVRDCIKSYVKNEGKAVLLTSHILSEVDELSDRISLMRDGRTIHSGTSSEWRQLVKVKDFIDIPRQQLPVSTLEKLTSLPHVALVTEDEANTVVSLGVHQIFDGMEAILKTLREDQVYVTFQHRPVSLEDVLVLLLTGKEGDSYELAHA